MISLLQMSKTNVSFYSLMKIFFILMSFLCLSYAQAQSSRSRLRLNQKTNRIADNLERTSSSPSASDTAGVSNDVPTLVLWDGGADELQAEGDQESVASLLTGGGDVFVSLQNFVLRSVRFRMRGYDFRAERMHVNTAPLVSLYGGSAPFRAFAGVTQLLYRQQLCIGVQNCDFAFGSYGGNTNLTFSAAQYRRERKIRYGFSNRVFQHRVSLTYNTGALPTGWSFASIIDLRYATNGYIFGTPLQNAGVFLSASKQLNGFHGISVSALGGYTTQGRHVAILRETQELNKHGIYNPSWGMDQGKVRNARTLTFTEPMLVLTHNYRKQATAWTNTLLMRAGQQTYSTFEWFNVANPAPDYYQKLPSHFSSDPELAARVRQTLIQNPSLLQIDWARIRDINSSNSRAHIILGQRVQRVLALTGSSVLNEKIASNVYLTLGANVAVERNHFFQRVDDLLGASYWLNVNAFLSEVTQEGIHHYANDIQETDQRKYKGDTYGSNYALWSFRSSLWMQNRFIFQHFDAFVGAALVSDQFFRRGYVQNELFRDRSVGTSTVFDFLSPQIKFGVTYKHSARQYLSVFVGAMQEAPNIRDVFVLAYSNDITQPTVRNRRSLNAELRWNMNTEPVRLRASIYANRITDGMRVHSFYNDEYQVFTSYALSGIDRLHAGAELGAEARLPLDLTLKVVSAYGYYVYTSRPRAVVYASNQVKPLGAERTIYYKGLFVEGSPQRAHSIALTYRSPQYWYVEVNAVYTEKNYVYMNPQRRTAQSAIDINRVGERDLLHKIFGQERLPAMLVVNVFAGYSLRLPWRIDGRNMFISTNLSVQNIQNQTNTIVGGFEQLRYDIRNRNPDKFPTRYAFGYGMNYLLNVQFSF